MSDPVFEMGNQDHVKLVARKLGFELSFGPLGPSEWGFELRKEADLVLTRHVVMPVGMTEPPPQMQAGLCTHAFTMMLGKVLPAD